MKERGEENEGEKGREKERREEETCGYYFHVFRGSAFSCWSWTHKTVHKYI